MAHSIIRPAVLFVIIANVFSCCGSNHNRCAKQVGNENDAHIIGFQDTVLKRIPLVPSDYYSLSNNIWKAQGMELSKKEVQGLIRLNIGILFPRGITIDTYSLDSLVLPTIHMYIVGKWAMAYDIEALHIKGTKDNEDGVCIYLVTCKEGKAIDAITIAFVQHDYYHYGDCEDIGPVLSERNSCHSFTVKWYNGRGDVVSRERSYSISPAGQILPLD